MNWSFTSADVNFTNILLPAFTLVGPKSVKKNTAKSSVSFSLLGSTGAKAERRMFTKLSPGVSLSVGAYEQRLCNLAIARYNLVER